MKVTQTLAKVIYKPKASPQPQGPTCSCKYCPGYAEQKEKPRGASLLPPAVLQGRHAHGRQHGVGSKSCFESSLWAVVTGDLNSNVR